MAPYFPNGDDKNTGYPWTSGLSPGRGSTSNCLVWSGSQWSAGGTNQYPYTSTNTSSYTVLDQIIQYFDNATLFPKMNQIVIAGHSLGAQTVQRYAAIGQSGNIRTPLPRSRSVLQDQDYPKLEVITQNVGLSSVCTSSPDTLHLWHICQSSWPCSDQPWPV